MHDGATDFIVKTSWTHLKVMTRIKSHGVAYERHDGEFPT